MKEAIKAEDKKVKETEEEEESEEVEEKKEEEKEPAKKGLLGSLLSVTAKFKSNVKPKEESKDEKKAKDELTDETRVRGTPWGDLKRVAMKPDAHSQKWYTILSKEDKELLGRLVVAQMAQGDRSRLIPESERF